MPVTELGSEQVSVKGLQYEGTALWSRQVRARPGKGPSRTPRMCRATRATLALIYFALMGPASPWFRDSKRKINTIGLRDNFIPNLQFQKLIRAKQFIDA